MGRVVFTNATVADGLNVLTGKSAFVGEGERMTTVTRPTSLSSSPAGKVRRRGQGGRFFRHADCELAPTAS
jgi:hypothetical protein